MNEAPMYSLQLRLVEALAGDTGPHRIELTPLPEAPGEPSQPHFEQWEPLSDRLSLVTRSTPFHLKAIYRTLVAGLTASLIDRKTGAPLIFSHGQLKELGLAS